ncbi:MAG: formylglycine-generating enzyme family protein [Candidatus Omnitrophota bacterium]
MIVTDNQYTFDDLSGWLDYDRENDRELVLRWNPSEEERNNPDIVDYYVHVLNVSIGSRQIQHLGRANSNRPPYLFEWKANSPLVADAFRNGPELGGLYFFHVFPVTKNEGMIGVGYYTYYPVTYEEGDADAPLPTYAPTPSSFATPEKLYGNPRVPESEVYVTDDRYSSENLGGKEDYDEKDARELAIWWEKSGGSDYFQVFHIFVLIDSKYSEYLGSLWRIERPFFFVWEPNSPLVSLKLRNGPEFGHEYSFGVFHIDYTGKRWGGYGSYKVKYIGLPLPTPTITPTITPTATITPTFTPTATNTPTATPIVLETKNAVHVYDEPWSTGDLTRETDFDAPDAVNITIAWDHVNANALGWDVYVRQDGLGYQFLIRCAADAASYDWRPNAPDVSPLYLNGPQFNHTYQFRVYPLGVTSGPRIILEQLAPVLLSQEGAEPAAMPTIPIPNVPAGRVVTHTNLMKGNISPPMDWLNKVDRVPDGRAILIAWNFGEDSPLVKDYHIWVKVDEMDKFEFLGITGSSDIQYFEWSFKSGFYTSSVYREGPQKSKCYRFQIVGLSSDGVNRSMESEWTLNNELEVHRVLLPNLSENNIPLDFIMIYPGSFRIGSPEGEFCRSDDEIRHRVTLTKDFYLGKYEVTNAQWINLMAGNKEINDIPVDNVTWQSIQRYLQKLNNLGLGVFRLPTEAEWEYACRAGTTTMYYWGEDELDNNGSMKRLPYYVSVNNGAFSRVGLKLPNLWGLFDMGGNVYERCQDWYGQYIRKEQIDPNGPSIGTSYVCRGGGSNKCDVRSAKRYYQRTTSRNDYGIGLRLVWEPDAGMGD